jgi:uncharacterized protein
MKRSILFIVFAVVLVLGLAAFFFSADFFQSRPQKEFVSKVEIRNVSVEVEVVDDEESRNKGLGRRESLAENKGMLFVFNEEDFHMFWMKGMNFPLDIIWINDGVVVDLIQNVSHPSEGTLDTSLPIYRPEALANFVLEVNAGFVEENDIQLGDQVQLCIKSDC